jgi:putative tryptophan/tyrosine transport system substrate-binding protein
LIAGCRLLSSWALAALVLCGSAGCSAPADGPRDVAFLNPAGHARDREAGRFRQAFEATVQGLHPRARLQFHDVSADSIEASRAGLSSLKRHPPAVIVTIHTTLAQAVAREMPQTPLVLLTMADPVVLGIVDDAVAPRTNVSGFTSHVRGDLKHAELLKDAAPGIRRLGVIAEDYWASGVIERRLLHESFELFGMSAVLVRATTTDAVARIAQTGRAEGLDAWFVPDTPFNRIHAKAIAREVVSSGKPSIAGYEGHVEAGGLMAYSVVRPDPFPRLATIVALILSGVPAREIPFERPKHFRMVVNLSRAQQLGLQLPRSIFLRADELTH